MNRDHILDRNQTQSPTANGGRLVLAVHQVTFVISMVVVMVAAFALNVFLEYALGLETTEIGSLSGFFLALGGLLAFIFFWSAIVTALQGWLIKRYSGVVPARKMWVPPYWRRDRGQEDEELQPSLYNNAPGARFGRGELATLVGVAPVTATVSILCGFVLMYLAARLRDSDRADGWLGRATRFLYVGTAATTVRPFCTIRDDLPAFYALRPPGSLMPLFI